MERYIYIDRESAKEGITLVFGCFEEKIENFNEYYDGKAIEFHGEDIPHYITYVPETDSIREATEEEKLERGQRILNSDEILLNGKIQYINKAMQKVVDNKIIDKTREDLVTEGTITLETEKIKARDKRKELLKVLDLLDTKIAVGRIKVSDEEEKELTIWYQTWLEIPEKYTDISKPIEDLYPVTPSRIINFL